MTEEAAALTLQRFPNKFTNFQDDKLR